MTDNKETMYIDANVFINNILYDVSKNIEAQRSNDFLKKIVQGEIVGITSALTWDEFTWIVKVNLGREVSIIKAREFLVFPNLFIKNITVSSLIKAQEIITSYNVRPRDAIHAACALENNVRVICSFDADFDLIKEITRVEP
ncbi:MAG: type II toxin-antitoxin system VapC family toxin [Candidatus Lokiarchaeota archaeon]|nr:type II toxin-antitoxin system VapC family toxin [Candidatus Lokiarchaeota archaeon]